MTKATTMRFEDGVYEALRQEAFDSRVRAASTSATSACRSPIRVNGSQP